MSFKPEVIADNSGKWATNSLRFATAEEALASANELASRWFAVRDTRASESDDEITHRWDAEQQKAVEVVKVVSFTGVRSEPAVVNHDLEAALDSVDAAVFTGVLSTAEAAASRNRLRWYMQRWVKELKL